MESRGNRVRRVHQVREAVREPLGRKGHQDQEEIKALRASLDLKVFEAQQGHWGHPAIGGRKACWGHQAQTPLARQLEQLSPGLPGFFPRAGVFAMAHSSRLGLTIHSGE